MTPEEIAELERRATEALDSLLSPMSRDVVEKAEKLRRQVNALPDMEFLALYMAVMQARDDRMADLLMRFPFLRDQAIRKVPDDTKT